MDKSFEIDEHLKSIHFNLNVLEGFTLNRVSTIAPPLNDWEMARNTVRTVRAQLLIVEKIIKKDN